MVVRSSAARSIKWIWLGTAALVFLLPISFFSYLVSSEETRVPFTVHAKLLDGTMVYEGEAVWELHLRQAHAFSHSLNRSVRGEAFQLVGPEGRNYFLLRVPREGGSSLTYGDYPMRCVPGRPRTNFELIKNMESSFEDPCVLDDRSRPPQLVEISDLHDPTTIRPVPYTLSGTDACHDMCLEVWVERTDEPISYGILDKLPWLRAFKYGMTDVVTGAVPKSGRAVMTTINLVDFTTEFSWSRKMYD